MTTSYRHSLFTPPASDITLMFTEPTKNSSWPSCSFHQENHYSFYKGSKMSLICSPDSIRVRSQARVCFTDDTDLVKEYYRVDPLYMSKYGKYKTAQDYIHAKQYIIPIPSQSPNLMPHQLYSQTRYLFISHVLSSHVVSHADIAVQVIPPTCVSPAVTVEVLIMITNVRETLNPFPKILPGSNREWV